MKPPRSVARSFGGESFLSSSPAAEYATQARATGVPGGQFSLHMLNQSNAIDNLLGRRSLRLQLTSSGCGSARPRWCRRRAPRSHATQKRYLALRKHGSATRHSISPSRVARRQARAFAPRGAVCLSLSQNFFFFSFFLFNLQGCSRWFRSRFLWAWFLLRGFLGSRV